MVMLYDEITKDKSNEILKDDPFMINLTRLPLDDLYKKEVDGFRTKVQKDYICRVPFVDVFEHLIEKKSYWTLQNQFLSLASKIRKDKTKLTLFALLMSTIKKNKDKDYLINVHFCSNSKIKVPKRGIVIIVGDYNKVNITFVNGVHKDMIILEVGHGNKYDWKGYCPTFVKTEINEEHNKKDDDECYGEDEDEYCGDEDDEDDEDEYED